MANFKTFSINGKSVNTLFIDGMMVKMGIPDYLCFTAEEDGSTISLIKESSPDPINIVYSTDGIQWSTFDTTTTVTLQNIGDKIYMRSNGSTTFSTENGTYRFVMTGKIASSGNIQFLIDPTGERTDVPDYSFKGIFGECKSLVEPPRLPATDIGERCYVQAFAACSLRHYPELPAPISNGNSYIFMFDYTYGSLNNRNSATEIKIDLSSIKSNSGFDYMFRSQNTLKSISVDFNSWTGGNFFNWVYGVSSTGKFKCPIALGSDETIKRGNSNCPNNWVVYHGTDQLSNCAIRYTKDYVETGSEIRPVVQVYSDIDGELMTEGTGYTVSYSDNILPGTGHITITGLGDFAGQTVIKDFTIAPATIQSCTFEYNKVDKYTGSSVEPNVTIKNSIGNTLTRNTDYTVSYQDNTEVGTGKIIITGAGLYTGSKTLDFLIVSADDFKTTLWRNNTEPEATDYDVSGQMTTSNTGRSGWYNDDNAITKIQIGLGVTDVDQYYFYSTKALTEIDLTKFTNPNNICTSQAASPSNFASNIQNIYVANSEMETVFKAAQGWSYVANKISVKP